ncbi:MAG: glutamyl-tRNA synthetase [Rhodospirillaceae bacterium]|nr:MAG: glutamyl-tRNA synthetase [Rhodospirillaceae bacterium]
MTHTVIPITRFAPSPTGFLHIGGARTALFNWLYARRYGGRFHLRIEDTDRARSTPEAVEAIFAGLQWLGLTWDGEAVFQFARAARHAAVAHFLLERGLAYRCYCTPAELAAMRESARQAGRPAGYDGRWRDRDAGETPAGIAPTIRLRAPRAGETIIDDLVQGRVRVANEQLDDMVLLRADGTPTYMLSVVVDDHDMGITHVIRGDDHLTNAFRQSQISQAMGWEAPRFAHIPLIHGADGAKMSKRHGALGVEAYRVGFLPEAMRNYLVRLGWGHGDAEIFTTEQAIAWFDITDVGRGAARFDLVKLTALNAHYLREADDARLVKHIRPLLETLLGGPMEDRGLDRLRAAMASLKVRARTVTELAEAALFYVRPRPIPLSDTARQQLAACDPAFLAELAALIAAHAGPWTARGLEENFRLLAEGKGLALGKLAQPLRAALTGATISPPLFEVMHILGQEETRARLNDVMRKEGNI